MISKFFFEYDISDEEKVMLKSMITCKSIIPKKLGFYFTKNIKNINDYVQSQYKNVYLANCNTKFFISTKEIQGVSKCLSSIIEFLLDQETKEYYSIVINKVGENIYKLVIYEQIINIKTDHTGVTSSDPRITYFLDIVNNVVTSFNSQYLSYYKYILVQNQSKRIFTDDVELIFENNKEHYDLVDQYDDFVDYHNGQKVNKITKNDLPINLIKNKSITIINKETQFTIKFTNCDCFDQIIKYLREQFGDGELNYEVDLKENKTIITYVLINT